MVTVVGILGTFLFSVCALNASPGLFISSLTLLTSPLAFWVSIVKTALFGLAAALVSCYLGMNARGGPKGVGEAVNQTVVFTLLVLAVINTLVTTVYVQIGGGA